MAGAGRLRSVEVMESTPSNAGLVARVANVTKIYRTDSAAVNALDDVSLGIGAGEFTAIMGASGSGKSTLMHIMAGLDAPTTGRVWIGDQEITGMGDAELTLVRRRRVGFVFQAFNLVPSLDVAANIRFPFELDGHSPSGSEQAWIDDLVDSLGLRDRLSHRPAQLSGGQQQRVAIARALSSRPALVFADEPTGSLDSRTGREVLALLATAASEYGQAIAMVTHDPVAASHADRVVFINDGRIVADRRRMAAAEVADYVLGIEARA